MRLNWLFCSEVGVPLKGSGSGRGNPARARPLGREPVVRIPCDPVRFRQRHIEQGALNTNPKPFGVDWFLDLGLGFGFVL